MKQSILGICAIAAIVVTGCEDRSARGAAEALAEGDLETARALYAGGLDPDELHKGHSALTMAACQGSPEVIELLLDAGADPNLVSSRRLTPLIYAARCGNLAAVRLLLEGGADPNLSAPGGMTALSAARDAGKHEVVELLLEAGADSASSRPAGRRRASGL